MELLLKKAFEIAVEVHGDQRDKAGEPYLFHVMRVAMQMDSDGERVVALLHDVFEDSLSDVSLTLPYEIVAAYGSSIFNTVKVLTRRNEERYMDYIRRLSANPLAAKVKLADLIDNADPKRLSKLKPEEAARLSRKYDEAYCYLTF